MLTKDLQQEIIEYIKQPVPRNMFVVEQSIPVVFFGDIESARCATLSINPSRIEFLDVNQELLQNYQKRFCDRDVIGVADTDWLTPEQSQAVYDSLINYFNGNPYKKWFGPIGKFAGDIFDTSYYDNSMVHLDIYPWATDPTWSGLSVNTQKRILGSYDLFAKLISAPERLFDCVYVNGITVKMLVEQVLKIKFKNLTPVRQVNRSGSVQCWVPFYYKLDNGCVIVGSNANIPGCSVTVDAKQDIIETLRTVIKK